MIGTPAFPGGAASSPVTRAGSAQRWSSGRGLRPAFGTPVLVLAPALHVGPLAAMRSLGELKVPVFGLRHIGAALADRSRFCAGLFDVGVDARPDMLRPDVTVAELLAVGHRLGPGALLLPGSDEWAVFIDLHAEELDQAFTFSASSATLVQGLADKSRLAALAAQFGLKVPRTKVFGSAAEAAEGAAELRFPVIVKPRLTTPLNFSKVLASDEFQLSQTYAGLDIPVDYVCQELVGGRTEGWLFDACFDSESRCIAAWTGRKVRQLPFGMGIATLAESRFQPRIAAVATDFLSRAGYSGIVDIDFVLRLDTAELVAVDVNPRLGGAFRTFVDADGLDVVRAWYGDLTGRAPATQARVEGRRWVQEAGHLVVCKQLGREGESRRALLAELRGVAEGATWRIDDPLPFFQLLLTFAWQTVWGRLERLADRVVGKRRAELVKPWL